MLNDYIFTVLIIFGLGCFYFLMNILPEEDEWNSVLEKTQGYEGDPELSAETEARLKSVTRKIQGLIIMTAIPYVNIVTLFYLIYLIVTKDTTLGKVGLQAAKEIAEKMD